MKIDLSALSLLTILFVGLKLTNYINWSWWLVLSPTLFQVALVVLFLLLAFVCAMAKEMLHK